MFLLLILLFSHSAMAVVEHNDENHGEKKKFDAGKMIMHHIADAHQVHFVTLNEGQENESHFAMPLPIILFDNGTHLFSSSHFYHHPIHLSGIEDHAYEHGDYIMVGEVIYKKNTEGTLAIENGEIAASNIKPFDFSITKSVAGLFLTGLILILVFVSVAKAYKKQGIKSAPRGLQSFMESIIIFVRDDIVVPSIGKKKAGVFLPFLLTTFFFIWIANMLGLIPFLGGLNIMGTLSVTMVLAIFVFIFTNIKGNKNYWMHIVSPPNVPLAIKLILVPIEILQIFIRPLVLMIRLTANITAGHIIILAFVSLIFIFGESSVVAGYGVGLGSLMFMIFMNFIELLVAFLQAYVFTLLAALYFGGAVEEAHH